MGKCRSKRKPKPQPAGGENPRATERAKTDARRTHLILSLGEAIDRARTVWERQELQKQLAELTG